MKAFPPFRIFPAAPGDIPVIAQLHYQCWIETYTGLIDQAYLDQLSPQRSRKDMERGDYRQFLLLTVGDEPAGFCSHCRSRDADVDSTTGEVQSIYLLKTYQHRGYGRALMERALTELQQMGMQRVTLWVLSTNRQAIAFYERCGFTTDGAVKEQVIGSPVTELRMGRNFLPDKRKKQGNYSLLF